MIVVALAVLAALALSTWIQRRDRLAEIRWWSERVGGIERLPRESVKAYDTRVRAEITELHDASDAMVAKASALGQYQPTSALGGYFWLDDDTPEAKRYGAVKARIRARRSLNEPASPTPSRGVGSHGEDDGKGPR